jgi:nucleoside-diphosphate-sugar epimerase
VESPKEILEPFSGARVRALVRSTSDVRHLDSRKAEQIEGHLGEEGIPDGALTDVDLVLHLAALTRARDEGEFGDVNVGGTRRLLEAARLAGNVRKFVYVSSLAAVGPARDGRPVQPQDEPRPLTAYGRTKLAGERACQDLDGAFDVVILRPPAVYGPRDRDLLTFFRMAGRGLLPVPTGPVRTLQMVHVSDLVRAILLAGAGPAARGIYHVAEEQAYSWHEVMELMAGAVGRQGYIVPLPQRALRAAGALSGALGRLTGTTPIFDRDKARELLAPGWLCETAGAARDFGFRASIPLARGLKETAAWYRGRGWLR